MKNPAVFGNNKRTRSQLTLPDFNFDLSRSPLKDARVARRHNGVNHSATEDVALTEDGERGSQSSSERTPPKRNLSPGREATTQSERITKRPKHDSPPTASQNSVHDFERHSAEPSWTSPSRKLITITSTASLEGESAATGSPTNWKRAQSVPPQSSTPKPSIPRIDFRKASPSPWKSPLKARLRIASVPPNDAVSDTRAASALDLPRAEKSMSPEMSQHEDQAKQTVIDMDAGPLPSNESTLIETPVLDGKVAKSPEPLRIDMPDDITTTLSKDIDDPMGLSPMSPLSSSPRPQSKHASPLLHTAPPHTELLARHPSSTPPIHQTHSGPSEQASESSRPRRRSDAESIAESLRESVDTLTAGIRIIPKSRSSSVSSSSITPSSSTSQLPRLSVAPPLSSTNPVPSSSGTGTTNIKSDSTPVVDRPSAVSLVSNGDATEAGPLTSDKAASSSQPPLPTGQAKPPSRVKSTKPRGGAKVGVTPIPLGGRMTRSASLRLQESKKREEVATVAATETPKTPARPISRTNTNSSRPISRAGPSVVTDMLVPLKDEDGPSTPSVAPTTPGRTPSRARSKSFSYAQPTSSSQAKLNLVSPAKPRSMINNNNPPAAARLPTFDRSRASQPPPSSTLSNLSMALEKLNMPAPSRPNTSLGFNRAKSAAPGMAGDESDENEANFGNSLRGKRASSVFPDGGKGGGKAKDDIHLASSFNPTSFVSSTPRSVKPVSSAAALGSRSTPKPALLSRATTVGSFGAPGTRSAVPQRRSELMLPPPVPAKASSSKSPAENGSAQPAKKISLSSGMVAGKPKGKVGMFGPASRQAPNRASSNAGTRTPGPSGSAAPTGAAPKPKPRIFGVGSFTNKFANRVGGRVVHKASKPSPLPVVEGSPVKGGTRDIDTDAMEEDVKESEVAGQQKKPRGPFDFSDIEGSSMEVDEPTTMGGPSANGTQTPNNAQQMSNFMPPSTSGSGSSEKGKEKASNTWSRRASMASQLLSQSLSTLPHTPPRTFGSEGKGKGRAVDGSFAPSSSSSQAGLKTAPGALGRATGTGAHVSAHGKADDSGAAGASNANGSNGATVGSLKVLKKCKIFVDVRTDDGDDAGSLFVDMLRGMGAKILSRVGSTCTHIVFKNGLTSTITKYRLHEDPKPFVVGIAWVVECVEKRARVDETRFLIDLDLVNVAGTTKRRRSMLPKHLLKSPGPPSTVSPASEGNSRTEEHSSSPILGSDDSPRANTSTTSLDDLPPLERARRRKSTLFNHGITRT